MNNYVQIVALLKQHCSNGETGTAFITTADNKSARFTLKNGEIVSCSYRHIKGIDAISKIQTIESGQLSFTQGLALASADTGLPKTALLLDMLSNKNMPVDAPDINNKATAQKMGGSKLLANADLIISKTQAILTEYVGPMAPVLCSQFSADKKNVFATLTSFEHAITGIAEQINNPKESQEFSTRILEMVREIS